jgi:hypothetical protein
MADFVVMAILLLTAGGGLLEVSPSVQRTNVLVSEDRLFVNPKKTTLSDPAGAVLPT